MKQAKFKTLQFLVFMMAIACFLGQGKAKFCSNSLISSLVQLIPCRPALSPFHPIPPSLLCCNAIKTLGQSCLCALLDAPPVSGVDYNLAMSLPQKCATNFDPCKFFSCILISTSFKLFLCWRRLECLESDIALCFLFIFDCWFFNKDSWETWFCFWVSIAGF